MYFLQSYKVGFERDSDGWIYCGVSLKNGQDMWVAPENSGVMSWYMAHEFINNYHDINIGKQGSASVRMPYIEELNQIFLLRDAIKNFPIKKEPWYWSNSSHLEYYAFGQEFERGRQHTYEKFRKSNLRMVK